MNESVRFDPAQFMHGQPGTKPAAKPQAPNASWGAMTYEETSTYLASASWARRKAEYFAWVRSRGFEPACQVCSVMLKDVGHLDLHHHSYTRVFVARPHGGQYVSWESSKTLVPMCRDHHIQLHRKLGVAAQGEGYMDLLYANSAQILRSMRKKHLAGTPRERLGLIPTTPPNENRHRNHTGIAGSRAGR